MTTPPTPDAGRTDVAETLKAMRFMVKWCHTDTLHVTTESLKDLLDHIATLTAQLAAAKADGERAEFMATHGWAPDVLTNENGTHYRMNVAQNWVQDWRVAVDSVRLDDAARTGAR